MAGSLRVIAVSALVLLFVQGLVAQDNGESFSDNCLLTKTEKGKELKWDISILTKSQNSVDPNLGLAANWYAHEKQALANGGTERDDFTYYINVCSSLVNAGAVASGTGMYQIVKEDGNRSAVGGTISNSILTSLRDDDLRLVYGPGDPSVNCINDPARTDCPKRKTVILFLCADVGYGSPVFVDETAHLEYMFVWNTCAACPLGHPLRDTCAQDPIDECRFLGGNSSIGTGTILVLTFFILLSFYLVIGTLYKRFVLGARGSEQIPNVDMWCNCFEAISIGCSSMCGMCSGGQQPLSTYQSADLDLEDDDSDLDSDADEKV